MIVELRVPPPLVALVLAGGMWVIAESTTAAWLILELPRALPLGLLLAGVAVELSAVVLFLRASTTVNPMRPGRTARLIETGIYRLSRNPMYLGLLLVLFAWASWLGSVPNLAVLVFYVWYITRFQIIPEERVLERLFPERFNVYRARVRRWL